MTLARLTTLDRGILVFSLLLISTTLLIGALAASGHSPLPDRTLCLSRRVFDLECPGCGITRSLVLLGRGQIAASFTMNPLGLS
ncbi:MAG TPA: DUF2752 domain-containing protein, partial [Thermoanaerobaculia bacterium]|nr:DUF2752 domain-containing protein [Thermoanaerobaculia bacterium]